MLTITALAVALAQFIPPNTPLPPRTYFSPSRAWSLFVDPSHRYGGGKSTITISRQGKVQWAGEQPFTFHEAVINDEGVSAGYGYTHGEWADDGEMVIAIVGASGESLLVDETPRHGGGADDMGPSPSGEMMILQPERNIAVVLPSLHGP